MSAWQRCLYALFGPPASFGAYAAIGQLAQFAQEGVIAKPPLTKQTTLQLSFLRGRVTFVQEPTIDGLPIKRGVAASPIVSVWLQTNGACPKAASVCAS